jgi:hypothetical protein
VPGLARAPRARDLAEIDTHRDVAGKILSAQRQLGTKTKRDTINRALAIAAGTSADDRARGLAWLQGNAAHVLDFEGFTKPPSPTG